MVNVKYASIGGIIAVASATAAIHGCSLVADLGQFDGAAEQSGTTVDSGSQPDAPIDGSDVPVADTGSPGTTSPDSGSDAQPDAAAGVDSEALDSGADSDDSGPQNLIENPGFEDGTLPWTTFTDNSGHSAVVGTTSSSAHSGHYSGWVSDRTATFQGTVQDVTGRVVQGRSYTMEAWTLIAVPDAGPGGAQLADVIELTAAIACVTDGSSVTTYKSLGSGTTNSASWTPSSGVLAVPTCDSLTVSVYVEGPAPGLDLFVDDVSLLP